MSDAQTTAEQGSEWSDDEISRMVDEHEFRKYDAEAAYSMICVVRDDLTQRLQQAEAERDKLRQQLRDERRMFEDLTPGGSEFHDSPRNVLRWIEQQLNSSRISTIKALKQERDEARQELVECRARLSGTEAAGS